MLELKLKLRVTKIKKRTQAKVFKDLKVGDEILLSSTLDNYAGYQKMLKVKNLTTGEEDYKYFTVISNTLNKFEFEEIL